MGLVTTANKAEFEKSVIQNSKVVLVDFWAEWCAPCRAMAPTLEKVATKHDKDVDIVKVDIEESIENHHLAGDYDVRSIPNMVIFKNGKEVDRIIGMVSGSILEDKLLHYAS